MTRLISRTLLVVLSTLWVQGHAYAEDKTAATILIPTDNGSVIVEVAFDRGNATQESLVLDSPQQANVSLRFLDPTTKTPLANVNYDFVVVQEVGSAAKNVLEKRLLHSDNGMDSHLVPFEEIGSFLLTINVHGTGANEAYDTKYSGIAPLPITVTPEFSAAFLVAGLSLVGIIIAVRATQRTQE